MFVSYIHSFILFPFGFHLHFNSPVSSGKASVLFGLGQVRLGIYFSRIGCVLDYFVRLDLIRILIEVSKMKPGGNPWLLSYEGVFLVEVISYEGVYTDYAESGIGIIPQRSPFAGTAIPTCRGA